MVGYLVCKFYMYAYKRIYILYNEEGKREQTVCEVRAVGMCEFHGWLDKTFSAAFRVFIIYA